MVTLIYNLHSSWQIFWLECESPKLTNILGSFQIGLPLATNFGEKSMMQPFFVKWNYLFSQDNTLPSRPRHPGFFFFTFFTVIIIIAVKEGCDRSNVLKLSLFSSQNMLAVLTWHVLKFVSILECFLPREPTHVVQKIIDHAVQPNIPFDACSITVKRALTSCTGHGWRKITKQKTTNVTDQKTMTHKTIVKQCVCVRCPKKKPWREWKKSCQRLLAWVVPDTDRVISVVYI